MISVVPSFATRVPDFGLDVLSTLTSYLGTGVSLFTACWTMLVALTGSACSASPVHSLANSACAATVETPSVSGRTVTLYVTLFVPPAGTVRFVQLTDLLPES